MRMPKGRQAAGSRKVRETIAHHATALDTRRSPQNECNMNANARTVARAVAKLVTTVTAALLFYPILLAAVITALFILSNFDRLVAPSFPEHACIPIPDKFAANRVLNDFFQRDSWQRRSVMSDLINNGSLDIYDSARLLDWLQTGSKLDLRIQGWSKNWILEINGKPPLTVGEATPYITLTIKCTGIVTAS